MKYDLVIMDWGIGGLSVYREVTKVLPALSILYYSDSGQMPYGKMSARVLENRLRELIYGFADQGITNFVIACNAASTALPVLQPEFKKRGLNVTGMIDRGIELVNSTKFKDVGVIGGRRTILSRLYTSALNSKRRKVRGRIAQPLSALIEKGDLESKELSDTLEQILSPLKSCDALLLACTHYPAASRQIQIILPNCKLLDPAKSTAQYIKSTWKFKKLAGASSPLFMTSGDARAMKRSAELAFGIKIASVKKVPGTFLSS